MAKSQPRGSNKKKKKEILQQKSMEWTSERSTKHRTEAIFSIQPNHVRIVTNQLRLELVQRTDVVFFGIACIGRCKCD